MTKPTRRAAVAAAALIALLAAGCAASERTARPAASTTPAAGATDPAFPADDVADTTRPATANGKVGEVFTLSENDSGRDVARVTVDRIRFSAGDEYNRPERGHFLGVHVKVKALADGQSSLWGDFYVLAKGHHYDGDAYAEGFTPSLDYVDLQAGETAEGWLVFDVPSKHGQVVLGAGYEGGKLGTWAF